MIYQYSSSKEVVGNVIRNTRVTDSSYILDLPDWIGEATSFMRTNMDLVRRYMDVRVHFHAGKLPPGFSSAVAIEYRGSNLTYSKSLQYHKHSCVNNVNHPDQIFLTEYPMQVERLPRACDTYYTEGGYIKTSFADGTIRIHYEGVPVDEDCFPMIPDNANYKQALYWHCRAMMIGAGYEDKVFNYEYCDSQFEKYAARAIAGIRYPSMDMMDKRTPTIAKYLPDNFMTYFRLSNGDGCDLNGSSGYGTTGFMSQLPPVYIHDKVTETIIIHDGNGGTGAETKSFVYYTNDANTVGNVVTLSFLIGKKLLELFLDAYLLVEELNPSAVLSPNTFRFDSSTGILTFHHDMTPDEVVQGLYKPL